MKILYLSWGYEYDNDIISTFRHYSVEVKQFYLLKEKWKPSFTTDMEGILKKNLALELNKIKDLEDYIVFSINFNGKISQFCEERSMPYCSWVLQLPNFDLYGKEIFNSCNYIGICDSYLVEKLLTAGVKNAFFLADAVGESFSGRKESLEEREFCFVGQQPQFAMDLSHTSLYSQGYLNAVIHAQRVNSQSFILDDGLIQQVYEDILKDNPIPSYVDERFKKLFFTDYYLSPYCTIQMQNVTLQNLQSLMTIYSNNKFEICNCQKNAYPEKSEERKQIYQNKEFTLVLGAHEYHHGVPRQVFEVISAGGFPMCRYYKDFDRLFQQEENIVSYKDADEFDKMLYKYGNNPEERERVLENSYKYVQTYHTYKNRIAQMLQIWSNL